MNATRGFRTRIDPSFNSDLPIRIDFITKGQSEYDACAFCLNAEEKLYSDDHMIFYNQVADPNNSISYQHIENGHDVFTVSLQKVPDYIRKISFTVSIDGNATMSQINGQEIRLSQPGKEEMVCTLSPKDFTNETAVVCIEIYRKDGWRINFVCRGFNGGLGDLLRAYGGEEEESVPYEAHVISEPVNTTSVPDQRQTTNNNNTVIMVPASKVSEMAKKHTGFWVYNLDSKPYDPNETYPTKAFEHVPNAIRFACDKAIPVKGGFCSMFLE